MVGNTPWARAPTMLKTSPSSHINRKVVDNPDADERCAFCTICGVKTTIQQAMEIELWRC
jgi:hypothetical protein